jgi:cytochrome c oxidase assembly protein subunit 15
VAAGAANVLLSAPVWLQLVHLLLAELVWILLIVCLAEGQARPEVEAAVLAA